MGRIETRASAVMEERRQKNERDGQRRERAAARNNGGENECGLQSTQWEKAKEETPKERVYDKTREREGGPRVVCVRGKSDWSGAVSLGVLLFWDASHSAVGAASVHAPSVPACLWQECVCVLCCPTRGCPFRSAEFLKSISGVGRCFELNPPANRSPLRRAHHVRHAWAPSRPNELISLSLAPLSSQFHLNSKAPTKELTRSWISPRYNRQ
jgi:hypothetical protein